MEDGNELLLGENTSKFYCWL